jgi:hypothetical protein
MFSILAANSGSASEELSYDNSNPDSSLTKTVRVVSSIDYFLEK